MLNRILSFFGLMTIRRAKSLTTDLHVWYVRSVLDGVRRDFGKPEVPGATDTAREWWGKQFDSILEHQTNEVEITTEPKFLDYV